MKNYLDTISLIETGDIELIRSLQSMGYADEFNTNEWESAIGSDIKFPTRNNHIRGNKLNDQRK